MDSKAAGFAPDVHTDTDGARLRIYVIFTTLEQTTAALHRAEELSAGLNSRIALILTPVVPYPLPLDQPPTPIGFAQDRVRVLAGVAQRQLEAYVYFCRDPFSLLQWVLPPHSLIVIGGRSRWPFEKSERLARRLRRRGHQVITAKP
jgi:hypothetical protein